MTGSDDSGWTRRRLLARAGAVAAGAALSGVLAPGLGGCGTERQRMAESEAKHPGGRLPAIYLPHGGGPWPFVDVGFGDPADWDRLRAYLVGLAGGLPSRPRALLVVSAHWEEPLPTVMTGDRPPMLYDYYGFAPAAYQVQWPAPGEPAVAARVRALLEQAGIPSAADPARGFDHGTFVPLKLGFPAADVPCVQLSLQAGLDPAAHLAIGRALSPLRDEGVLIVGSGMSYHNMRGFGREASRAESRAFDGWLRETIALPEAERSARLAHWAEAPAARACHPREEHLLPLLVVAGAAGADAGRAAYNDQVMGVQVTSAHFG